MPASKGFVFSNFKKSQEVIALLTKALDSLVEEKSHLSAAQLSEILDQYSANLADYKSKIRVDFSDTH